MQELKKITSLQNPQIKKLVNLREAKTRRQLQQFIIEGVREQERAIKNGFEISEVYLCPELLNDSGQRLLDDLLKTPAIFYELSLPCFEKVAVRKGSDGLILIAKYKERSLLDFEVEKQPFVLVIEGVEKPGNIGALLRTADAAGIQSVLVIGSHKIDLFNPNLIRSSLGTCFSLPVFQCSREQVYETCKRNKIAIFAAVLSNSSVFYDKVDYSKGCALLLGSEDKGLDDYWVSHADQLISIPMLGQVDSLNVSAAGAVLMYEVVKQRI